MSQHHRDSCVFCDGSMHPAEYQRALKVEKLATGWLGNLPGDQRRSAIRVWNKKRWHLSQVQAWAEDKADLVSAAEKELGK